MISHFTAGIYFIIRSDRHTVSLLKPERGSSVVLWGDGLSLFLVPVSPVSPASLCLSQLSRSLLISAGLPSLPSLPWLPSFSCSYTGCLFSRADGPGSPEPHGLLQPEQESELLCVSSVGQRLTTLTHLLYQLLPVHSHGRKRG